MHEDGRHTGEAHHVGVDDAELGQVVKAFVVLKDGHALSERDVIRHCLTRLESFMAPKFPVDCCSAFSST